MNGPTVTCPFCGFYCELCVFLMEEDIRVDTVDFKARGKFICPECRKQWYRRFVLEPEE